MELALLRRLGLYAITLICMLAVGAMACGGGESTPAPTGTAKHMIIETNMGTITCELFPDKAPMTVEIIASLAEGSREWTHPGTGETKKEPYYNGIIFHRVIPNFMIQTGDPLGLGTGGPGFTFDDEFSPDLTFDRPGRLAMANRGANTNGGQFFITVTPTPHLNGKHTIFGQVIEGQEIADQISEVRTDGANKPNKEVVMTKVTIERE